MGTNGRGNRTGVLLATTAAIVALVAPLVAAPAGAAGHATWTRLTRLTGTSSVTTGIATAASPYVSCSSAGNCAEAANYLDNHDNYRAFLDDEINGTWSPAKNVLGVTKGAVQVQVSGLSCGSAGNCIAYGGYLTPAEEAAFFPFPIPFLEQEVAGVWQPAVHVPGLAALDPYSADGVDGVSCTSTGNCAVTGTFYTNGTFATFVTSEVNGVWQNATELPGLEAAGLSHNGYFESPVLALSCVSDGNCILGGELTNGGQNAEGFIAEETSGVWGAAELVPGLASLDFGSGAVVSAASCSSPGNCMVGGTYLDANNAPQAFLATETGGTWSNAIEVPGTAALNAGGGMQDDFGDVFGAQVQTASCLTDGNCTIVGWYESAQGASDLFVDSETGGTWATAIAMPGLAALNAGASLQNDGAAAAGLSCPSAGNCVIAGNYVDNKGNAQVFTEKETSGTFDTAVELPGSNAFIFPLYADPFADSVNSLSCTTMTSCVLAGSGALQGFLSVQSSGTWADAQTFVTTPTVYLGTVGTVTKVSCPRAGDCAAVGLYRTADGTTSDFFAQETNGVWSPDADLGTLSGTPSTDLAISSFSCAIGGNCVLTGSYIGADGVSHLVSMAEKDGSWKPPQEMPGLPTVAKGPSPFAVNGPRLEDVSCRTPRSCVGVGYDQTGLSTAIPFIAMEKNGTWRTTLDTTGTTNLPGHAIPTKVSCPTIGNCVVIGEDALASGAVRIFTVAETHGHWGSADTLISPSTLSTATGPAKFAFVSELACTSVRDCAAAGTVNIRGGQSEPFVMSKIDGGWRKARFLPGFKLLAKHVPRDGFGAISTVALHCPTARRCILVGAYPVDFQGYFGGLEDGWVVKSFRGHWSNVALLSAPRGVKLSKKVHSTFDFLPYGIACTSKTACSIVGLTEEKTVTQVNSTTWVFTYTYRVAYTDGYGTRYAVPTEDSAGITTYFSNGYSLNDVSCGPTFACAAGGSADDGISLQPIVLTG
jgi:hypothetical protein